MNKELLLEIGTEEIPALFLEESARDLNRIITKEFEKSWLEFGNVEIFYTPRRLAVRVSNLLPDQKERTVENFGPSKKTAFDINGKLTKAALGFARSQGVDFEQLDMVKRKNGEFLTFRKKIRGEKTSEVLKTLLPKIINSIHFRKSMRWGYGKTTFARPIRWIMCIYNGKKLEFEFDDIKSNSKSYGHRFTSPESFSPANWNDYIYHLEKKDVYINQSKRKKSIEKGIDELASKLGGHVEKDEELLETVNNLIECPVVLHGQFEKGFLKIPKEVLISVMKIHQKYFPVLSKSKKILPYFIFVCGTRVRNNETVIRGNEIVLRARFRDAEFFWNEDIKSPLANNLEKLETVEFLSRIGSYAEKTGRLKDNVENLAYYAGINTDDIAINLRRAAELSKADLVSKMVFEFPELQGIMGKYYARKSGEENEVATAIEEQYMPRERDGKLPSTTIGALLSIADKIDNICSCFAVGLKATGSADPHALRRQAIGIIQIVLKKQWSFNLQIALENTLGHVLQKIPMEAKKEKTRVDIAGFISERFKNLMLEEGYSNNVVDSVLSTGFDNILDSYNKIKALEKFKKQKGFAELAAVFKRVVNIIKEKPVARLDPSLFKDNSERKLHEVFVDINEKANNYNEGVTTKADYTEILKEIKKLKKPVDNFFNSVLVMDKDERLKNNRLALLNEIKNLFFRICDFSRI